MIRRTKIVCTIGPASSSPDMLARLAEAGMDVARLNFSHGTRETHRAVISAIREISERTGRQIGILQDLQGPKIRTGRVRNGAVTLDDGAPFVITTASLEEGDSTRVSTTYEALARDVQPGAALLLDDGYIALEVVDVHGPDIHTRVVKGGVLRDNKGIVAPGTPLSAPALSAKDLDDARFGVEAGVDAIALSFVRSERDIIELRSALTVFGRRVPVIAKIERMEGYTDIEDIVREANGVMVARGDLGLEMPVEDVPVLQKRIIERCNYYGKPVITATQMLESMIENPRPTRAEASDVANAVIDGSDCVMLSAETSVGRYPVEAVRMMDRIIRSAEAGFRSSRTEHDVPEDARDNIPDAIGRACRGIAEQIGAAVIVPLTTSGGTAKIVAKYRPSIPILALTDSIDTARRLAFVWGVQARLIPPLAAADALPDSTHAEVLASGLARPGDLIVVTCGAPLTARIPTNMLTVERLRNGRHGAGM